MWLGWESKSTGGRGGGGAATTSSGVFYSTLQYDSSWSLRDRGVGGYRGREGERERGREGERERDYWNGRGDGKRWGITLYDRAGRHVATGAMDHFPAQARF